MPIAESNYPFFELAFQRFETTKKKMTEKSKHILLMTPPLPPSSPGSTSVIEWGAGEQLEFSAIEFKETAKDVTTKR